MNPSEYFILFIFMALGLFSLVAAIFNTDWFFQTSGAATFIKLFGRQGARVFYALLGLGLITCGVLGLLYW
ncbi:MAG: immunity 17 family protein [Parabacteroides sp.]|jgi:hypothetical protein|nr:immunity 17 family protein [Parabacteroides sp.]MBP8760913.1 immunity 17 family protein [Parabacteroides sp.]MBP9580257.1 immunity 17 family protein [Parabacteroides sp.]MDD2416587.1 immunity 17 family protein [Parabacteroides sp.]MDD4406103.1 immunity 17 family protein [Parabacteroides sp.]